MKTTITIPDSRIVDLFVTACEGGSNYWCQSLMPKGKGSAYETMLEGFTLVDGESGETVEVSKQMIQDALDKFSVKEPTAFGDFLNENDDAETADIFLQLCTFGKVIYG